MSGESMYSHMVEALKCLSIAERHTNTQTIKDNVKDAQAHIETAIAIGDECAETLQSLIVRLEDVQ